MVTPQLDRIKVNGISFLDLAEWHIINKILFMSITDDVNLVYITVGTSLRKDSNNISSSDLTTFKKFDYHRVAVVGAIPMSITWLLISCVGSEATMLLLSLDLKEK